MTDEKSASHSNGTLDLEDIRGLLNKDSGRFLEGVANPDVDWFLRDTDISSYGPKHTEGGESSFNDTQLPLSSAVQGKSARDKKDLNPTKAHLNTKVSNSNEKFINKSQSTVSPIQPEVITSPPLKATNCHDSSSGVGNSTRRRSSVSSIGSTGSNSGGGLFSKIKSKFSSKSGDDLHQVDDITIHSQTTKERDNIHFHYPHGAFNPKYSDSVDSNLFESSRGSSNEDNLQLEDYKDLPLTSHPRIDEYIRMYFQENKRKRTCMRKRSSAKKTGYPNIVTEPLSRVESTVGNKMPFFFRKKNSISQPNLQESDKDKSAQEVSVKDATDSASFKELENEKQSKKKALKRVCFHSSTFLIDPPQQIPSRSPRKGNVEVLENGTIKIHPLTDQDKKAIEKSQMGLGGGLVVGGTGPLGLMKNEDDEAINKEANEKESIQSQPDDKSKEHNEEDPAVDKRAQMLGIEKAVIPKRSSSYKAPVKKMALDLMYTRACHLREILPIPAILKQIPKGSMAPLPLLQLKNPVPTLVEIQTFADFIRIAPIICISLDGVSLTLEQFTILLSSMSAKTQLEKLSLRNTPIDQEGWCLLCQFLSRNSALRKLDITQCPELDVKTTVKKRKRSNSAEKLKDDAMKRMVSNKENRTDVDWAMFTACIISRGGIEELILTGCCISDLEVFEKLVKNALSIKTSRLGLAYNQITVKQVKIVIREWLFRDFVRGLDIGYNDLSSTKFINTLLEFGEEPNFQKLVRSSKLTFLSVNATNLRYSKQWQTFFEKFLLKFPYLKYLDLSNNERLFGSDIATTSEDSADNSSVSENTINKHSRHEIVSYMTSKLPLFPKLIRLHLENNGFDTKSILSIAGILPFCKNLIYLSIIGNNIDVTAASALISALKNSKSLVTLDCDTKNLPDIFRERMGLYAMRNMERLLYSSDKKEDLLLTQEKEDKNEAKERRTLTAEFDKILSQKAEQKLDLNSAEVKEFFDKASKIRYQLKSAISEMLTLQLKNKLSIEGKETLFRFIFIDSSIEKGLQLIDSSFVKNNVTQSNNQLLLMTTAEDEKGSKNHKEQMNLLEKTESPALLDVGSSPLTLSRNHSKSNLSMLDKEEGSILKLSRLKEYHASDVSLNSFIDDLSGEEIRKKISGADMSDLDRLIDYLVKMKEKGISLGNVFNMKSDSSSYNVEPELEVVKHKLQDLINSDHSSNDEINSGTQGSEAKESSPRAKFELGETEESNEDHEYINEMFDKVLDDLQKYQIE